MADSKEVFSDPTVADADNDSFLDSDKLTAQTDPTDADRDNDAQLDNADPVPLGCGRASL